jgi:hypothetical protein
VISPAFVRLQPPPSAHPAHWPGSIPHLKRLLRMDAQTKREILILAIGTILVQAPIAFAAFTILSH